MEAIFVGVGIKMISGCGLTKNKKSKVGKTLKNSLIKKESSIAVTIKGE